jgi:large subunit ribosomal protein L15
MMIHEITAKAGRYKARKRVGRGKYGKWGKMSGRGQKGAGSRSGTSRRFAFEGGQMPFFRRIQKFGFTNAPFKEHFWIVNLRDIASHPSFAKGGEVNTASLIKAGLVRDDSRPLKVLGAVGQDGLRVKFNVSAHRITTAAKKLIESAGGKVVESGTAKDKVRGVDRMSSDLTPKNLTKKLKRPQSRGAAAASKDAAEGQEAKAAAKTAKGAPKGEKTDKPGKPPKGDKGE